MYLYVQDVGLIKWIIILMFHHYWHTEGRNILQLEFLTVCSGCKLHVYTYTAVCAVHNCFSLSLSLSHTHTHTHAYLARTNYSFQPIMHACVCVCVCVCLFVLERCTCLCTIVILNAVMGIMILDLCQTVVQCTVQLCEPCLLIYVDLTR